MFASYPFASVPFGTVTDERIFSNAESGSFSISGSNINTGLGFVDQIDAAAFLITGSEIVGHAGDIESILDSGSFLITGGEITTTAELLSVETGINRTFAYYENERVFAFFE